MNAIENFPFYKDLSDNERSVYRNTVRERNFSRGETIHRGDCAGLILVLRGRLRVFTVSEEGKEITLYRLTAGETCLLSASCMLSNISFEVFVTAETDCSLLLMPAAAFKELSENSLAVAKFANALMAERFSGAMWVLDQILNKKFDARLASLLLQEKEYRNSDELKITHEQLAAHLGTVREAVSRMLKYFEEDGLVSLFRGGIRILDEQRLRALAQ